MQREYSSRVCHSSFRDSERRFHLLLQQKLLGVFLEIKDIYAHARTVDNRPSFPHPQRPGYTATGDSNLKDLNQKLLSGCNITLRALINQIHICDLVSINQPYVAKV